MENISSKKTTTCTLDKLKRDTVAVVTELGHALDKSLHTVEVLRRLQELGFVAGERVRVLQRAMPGGDPIAVRVGSTTFALRGFEASLVSVIPE